MEAYQIRARVFITQVRTIGLSQTQVAEIFGVKQATVSRWMSGKSPINPTVTVCMGLIASDFMLAVERMVWSVWEKGEPMRNAWELHHLSFDPEDGVNVDAMRRYCIPAAVDHAMTRLIALGCGEPSDVKTYVRGQLPANVLELDDPYAPFMEGLESLWRK